MLFASAPRPSHGSSQHCLQLRPHKWPLPGPGACRVPCSNLWYTLQSPGPSQAQICSPGASAAHRPSFLMAPRTSARCAVPWAAWLLSPPLTPSIQTRPTFSSWNMWSLAQLSASTGANTLAAPFSPCCPCLPNSYSLLKKSAVTSSNKPSMIFSTLSPPCYTAGPVDASAPSTAGMSVSLSGLAGVETSALGTGLGM